MHNKLLWFLHFLNIFRAKDLHDKYIYTNGFIVRHPDKDGSFVNTKKQLYQKHLMDHPTIIRLKKEIKNLRENYIVPFKNLNLIEEEWVKNQLPLFIPYFMKDFEVQLCQGKDNVRFKVLLLLTIFTKIYARQKFPVKCFKICHIFYNSKTKSYFFCFSFRTLFYYKNNTN